MPEPSLPLLLPRPRRFELTGGAVQTAVRSKVKDVEVSVHDTPGKSPQGYRIRIDSAGVTVESSSPVGHRYAEQTLGYLLAHYKHQVPPLIIEDWPSFPIRGVMLDVSRDRVPTERELGFITQSLQAMKINHVQLYTEHTFAYQGHEEVWKDWSPLTSSIVRRFQDFFSPQGIELSANQNCFGHLSKWLNHPKYQHLAETLGDWVFQNETEAFQRSGPFSLCPTDPKSIDFIKDLLGQLLPCFDSPLVNIGCDETFDVGWGRSKAEVEKRGRAAVYMDFVRQICGVVNSHGKRPMFWADIALTDPKSIPLIPKDMIGLAWGYEPDAKFGEWCSQLRSAGLEAWVCPGTSSWRSITGRTTERRANIRRAAREGVANGATGFLITDWGDSGHHQQWPIALNAIAEAADAAWNADNLDSYDPRATSEAIFIDTDSRVASWLDQLGDADLHMRRRGGRVNPGEAPTHLRNSSVLFCDLHMLDHPAKHDDEKLRRGLSTLPVEAWEQTLATLEALKSSRPPPFSKRGIGLDSRIVPELDHTLEVAHLAATRGLWRRTGRYSASERAALAGRLRDIITEHRRLWHLRSREGGLEDSCSFYNKVLQDLETT